MSNFLRKFMTQHIQKLKNCKRIKWSDYRVARSIVEYPPYSIDIYRALLDKIDRCPNVVAEPFILKNGSAPTAGCVFVRHDIDTLECIKNMNKILAVDKEFDVTSGVYLLATEQQYKLADFYRQIRFWHDSGFEIGLHTTCYIHDNFMEAFKKETSIFESILGFKPKSFTVHGLGDYRYDYRSRFIEEIIQRMPEYGYVFSDCHSTLRTYSYSIEDCRLDQHNNICMWDDFFVLPEFYTDENYLILTHPCYWTE